MEFEEKVNLKDGGLSNGTNNYENENTNIEIKTIGEMNQFNTRFIVPNYQRGYRWGKDEIIKLLKDIMEYGVNGQSYFIQPIIYRISDDEDDKLKSYAIVDGQQRLTSLYILLKVIEQKLARKTGKVINEVKFNILYETKPTSTEYLREFEGNGNETIDIFHINLAKNAAEEQITKYESEGISLEQIKNQILNTKFIFYQVAKKDEKEFFKRINMGKIYLTNGELVKALLLNRKLYQNKENNEAERIKWATSWDKIEKELHNLDFWAMFNNEVDNIDTEYETRIDVILEIVAKALPNAGKISRDRRYWIFETFEEYASSDDSKKEEKIKNVWDRIKTCYETLKIWYEDSVIYNLIGYIISVSPEYNVEKLLDEYNSEQISSKTLFIKRLYGIIKEILNKMEVYDRETVRTVCENLRYDTGKNRVIKNILLLFNIITIINNNKEKLDNRPKEIKRFSFWNYKKEKFDIEHIHALNENNENGENNDVSRINIDLLRKVLNEENNKMLNSELDNAMTQQNYNEKEIYTIAFNNFYKKLLHGQDEIRSDETINSLKNLTLLDDHTNRGYKDNVFIIKRYLVLENDKSGYFIPVCTKNVFLKYYSKDINQIACWSEKDGTDYLEAIIEVLQNSEVFKEEEQYAK